MRKKILLALFTLTALMLHAQNEKFKPVKHNLTVSGIIKDERTGEPLPFATITVSGTNNNTTSNPDGFFTLLNVPSDTSRLIVSYLGYQINDFRLAPQMSLNNLVITLAVSGRTLKEVTVVANKEKLMSVGNAVSTIKISPSEIAVLPNVGEHDILRAFQLMPGVSGSNESSSDLYVRGGKPDQNLILYDGFTVYHTNHLYGFFSAFNSNAIKDVQLYKGGFESKYGGRLSSVTEITGKEGNKKQFNIGGDLSLLSANLFTEGPIGKKVAFLVAGRKSYKGPIYNKIFDKFNRESNNKPTNVPSGGMGPAPDFANTISSFFYDLNAKLSFHPTDQDILSLSFFNGTDKLDNSNNLNGGGSGPSMIGGGPSVNFDFKINDLTKYGNVGYSLRWGRKWSPKLYSNSIISHSQYFSHRDRSDNGTFGPPGSSQTSSSGLSERNKMHDYSFKTDYTFNISKNNQLDFGVNATHYDIAYKFIQSDSAIIDRRNKGTIIAGYIQDKLKFGDNKLSITPGIRITSFDVTGKTYFEPRLQATYNLTNELSIKAATGIYYQYANRVIREDILKGSKEFWILSDGNTIPVSTSRHYILGVQYDAKNYLFSIETYDKHNSGLTQYTLRFSARPQGFAYTESFYNGRNHSQGLEVLAQKKYGNLNGWISYTLAKCVDHFEVYSSKDYPADQDVTHEFKTVAVYKAGIFDFSATWTYATGHPYTTPSGAYTLTLLDGNTSTYFSAGAKNSLRMPAYHRLDVAATCNFRLGGKSPGSIGISIFNVYNRINTWYYEYEIVDQDIVSNAVTYLGLTPNLTLSLKLR